MDAFLRSLPKAELHLHIEGSLEPGLMFRLAGRNGVALPYDSLEEVRAAYDFSDLQSFLNLYYQGMAVLLTREDFHDLAMDYFRRAASEGVVHVDLSFDPQAHLKRGVSLDVQMEGLLGAMKEAESELGRRHFPSARPQCPGRGLHAGRPTPGTTGQTGRLNNPV